MNIHSLRVGIGHPSLKQQLTQAINVVRMKVREENALNVARIEAHFVDISCTGVAGVKHKKLLACNDQGAGAAALVIRHG